MRRRGLGRRAVVLALGICLVGGLVPSSEALAQRGSAQMRERRRAFHERFLDKPAPPFALKDRRGKTVRLEDLHGKVVILNFWFTACPPCRKETPALVRLYEKYRDEGLVVIGINLDAIFMPQSVRAQMEDFLRTHEVTYPILIGSKEVFDAYGRAPVQPTSFVVDRDGTVDRIFWGAYPGSLFDQAVRPLLARQPQAQKPESPAAAHP
jgi:peroxiredoxin